MQYSLDANKQSAHGFGVEDILCSSICGTEITTHTHTQSVYRLKQESFWFTVADTIDATKKRNT